MTKHDLLKRLKESNYNNFSLYLIIKAYNQGYNIEPFLRDHFSDEQVLAIYKFAVLPFIDQLKFNNTVDAAKLIVLFKFASRGVKSNLTIEELNELTVEQLKFKLTMLELGSSFEEDITDKSNDQLAMLMGEERSRLAKELMKNSPKDSNIFSVPAGNLRNIVLLGQLAGVDINRFCNAGNIAVQMRAALSALRMQKEFKVLSDEKIDYMLAQRPDTGELAYNGSIIMELIPALLNGISVEKIQSLIPDLTVYTAKQLSVILSNMVIGYDVTAICDPNLAAEQMEYIMTVANRSELLKEEMLLETPEKTVELRSMNL